MGALVYLSLGSNLGNREQFLEEALHLISSRVAEIKNVSGYYESEPWGFEAATQFLNICASLETDIAPLELLQIFQKIESELGREQKTSNGYASRVIDIDILTYGDLELDSDQLKIPHPQMGNRKFVLLPLLEIAPEFTHPKTGKTIKQIIAVCDDESAVLLYESK
ncbi:MAG: 2-amino-4-hydroxy-6-hydroxymethyldihydropteridine diphosphokinase [Fluviicola sp. XM-24bin1]|nr:MAG: 2-amino-4-hydroxy-6-hydroxymethyldihydropteridine diphosphokinase [Fluviicola sp. XM-24bin1]